MHTAFPLKALDKASLQMDPCLTWSLGTMICLNTQERWGTGSKKWERLFERGIQSDAELQIQAIHMGIKQKYGFEENSYKHPEAKG